MSENNEEMAGNVTAETPAETPAVTAPKNGSAKWVSNPRNSIVQAFISLGQHLCLRLNCLFNPFLKFKL